MKTMTIEQFRTLMQLIRFAESNHFGPVRDMDFDEKLYQLAPEGFDFTDELLAGTLD